MVFVYTAMGVLCVEHANVLKLCYIELLSGDSSFRLFSLSPSIYSSCTPFVTVKRFSENKNSWSILALDVFYCNYGTFT